MASRVTAPDRNTTTTLAMATAIAVPNSRTALGVPKPASDLAAQRPPDHHVARLDHRRSVPHAAAGRWSRGLASDRASCVLAEDRTDPGDGEFASVIRIEQLPSLRDERLKDEANRRDRQTKRLKRISAGDIRASTVEPLDLDGAAPVALSGVVGPSDSR